MNVGEYLIKCPVCGTETRLLCDEANPILFCCHGCDRGVVVHNNMIYTVSRKFLREILMHHRNNPCGRLVSANIIKKKRVGIGEEEIDELKQLLKQPMDVVEFINKIA